MGLQASLRVVLPAASVHVPCPSTSSPNQVKANLKINTNYKQVNLQQNYILSPQMPPAINTAIGNCVLYQN